MVRVVCPRCGSPSSMLFGSNPLRWSTARMKSSLDDALVNRMIVSQRDSSSIPPTIAPIFQYASECYITQGLQSAMEALHGVGLSWPYAFVVTGLALRVASSPLHILAEKLFARRLHAQNALVQGILKVS
ncbi:hypothetical protein KIN20_028605 [Parelaphostrongylus tenuis]|uniref:Uncharacterized protein n=1 Tax=Parelaphostrongylus tenuis TaxID=148309 RepID=A0AAD5R173_PARTN|nr:hypothetical protein KIN20_028605 [Parelaphostrongylus tenuis]